MSLSGRISVPTFPSVLIPTAPAHTTRLAMLAGRYLRDRGIASLSQADVERALLSALPEVADPLLPSIFVDDPRFTDIARGFRACLAAAPTSVRLGHVHARCALAHGLGYESIHALQAVLTGTSPVRVVESGPVRLVINPAGDWTQKSARVVRWLLIHADEFISQREIARATSMDEGFVSRIVKRPPAVRCEDGRGSRHPHSALHPSLRPGDQTGPRHLYGD